VKPGVDIYDNTLTVQPIDLSFSCCLGRLCDNCYDIQVIIFDDAIVNKRCACCDLKRSMDCGRNADYEGVKRPRSRA
jgi:hypothetical protein